MLEVMLEAVLTGQDEVGIIPGGEIMLSLGCWYVMNYQLLLRYKNIQNQFLH